MKKIILVFGVVMSLPILGFAQILQTGAGGLNQLLTDTKGEIIQSKNYVDVTGSPYMPAEKWQTGYVLLKTGEKYENIELRYNIYDDQPEYNKAGEAFVFKKGMVKEFSLKNPEGDKTKIFRCGFESIEKNAGNTYYEVIYDGKYKFLRDYRVTILETKAYNSASIEKRFDANEDFYLALPTGKLIKIKKNKKSLLEAVNQPKLEKWLDTQKNKCRNETEISEALKYLDTEEK